MSVEKTIRFSQVGGKARPSYRLDLCNFHGAKNAFRRVETLGMFTPVVSKGTGMSMVELNEDKIVYWLNKGAKPSKRVMRFLDATGVVRENRSKFQKIRIELFDSPASDAVSDDFYPSLDDLPEKFEIGTFVDSADEEASEELSAAARNFVDFLGYSVEESEKDVQ